MAGRAPPKIDDVTDVGQQKIEGEAKKGCQNKLQSFFRGHNTLLRFVTNLCDKTWRIVPAILQKKFLFPRRECQRQIEPNDRTFPLEISRETFRRASRRPAGAAP